MVTMQCARLAAAGVAGVLQMRPYQLVCESLSQLLFCTQYIYHVRDATMMVFTVG